VLKEASEIAKNTSEAIKNFHTVISNILQPKGIDLAIIEGHKRIIESSINREDIDELTKVAFLSNYKKMVREYENCSRIVEIALPSISTDSKPHDVEDDWFTFFFDKVRLISDETVQQIWGKILANEVKTPGAFQRSLLHTLSVMSKSQAEFFCNISRFCMNEYKDEDAVHPLLFISSNVESYENSRISPDGLLDLENLGLIQCDFKGEYIFRKKKVFRYGTKMIEVYGDPNNNDKIKAGNVTFTCNGNALFHVVGSEFKEYRSDILDFTITKLRKRNCKVIVNGQLVT